MIAFTGELPQLRFEVLVRLARDLFTACQHLSLNTPCRYVVTKTKCARIAETACLPDQS